MPYSRNCLEQNRLTLPQNSRVGGLLQPGGILFLSISPHLLFFLKRVQILSYPPTERIVSVRNTIAACHQIVGTILAGISCYTVLVR